VIKVATSPITNGLFGSAPTYTPTPDWIPSPGGTREGLNGSRVISGLIPGAVYYIAISAFDDLTLDGDWNDSSDIPGINVNNSAAAGALDPPSNFTGVAIGTGSIQWTWGGSAGASFYTLNTYPSGGFVDQTTNTQLTENGLSPNMSVSRTVRAANLAGLSSPSAVGAVYTLAAVPLTPVIDQVTFSSLRLSWLKNGNPANTQYRVERSLDGISFTALTLVSTTTLIDTGLTPMTTYSYRIRAMNGDGVLTAPSIVVSTQTPPQVDFIAPQMPMGLKGFLDSNAVSYTLIWENVISNTDGTPINDLAGYNVYRSSALTTLGVKLTPTPIATIAFADVVNEQTFFYRVRAVDQSGNESEDSLVADSSLDKNVIYLATDNVTAVIMPTSVNALLRSQHNKYGVPLTIQAQEEMVPPNTTIVRSLRLNYLRGDTFAVVSDLAFSEPQSIIAIGYNLTNGVVAPGAPNQFNAAPMASGNVTPDQLSIFWNNGITWVKVGGRANLIRQTVEVQSSYLGNYQLRVASPADHLVLEQANVFPRIFTPNGDGFNDCVYFVIENPNNASVQGEIFDLQGRKVTTLPGPAPTGIGTTLIWEGKDSSGAAVPSGAYLYKITGEGQTFTGSVGVAR